MLRIIISASGLAALWLLMSGLWTKPLILIFGVFSVALAVWIGERMDNADGQKMTYSIKPFATLKYTFWLLGEIAKSNWAVTKIILSPGAPKRQKLYHVGFTQRCDMAQVIFANSITLTPGTITVETEPDQFLVHGLDFSGHDDLRGHIDMDRRVSALETPDAKRSY